MGILGKLGKFIGLIPGIGTAVGTGLQGLDLLTSKPATTPATKGGGFLSGLGKFMGTEGGAALGTGLLGAGASYLQAKGAGKEAEKERKFKKEMWQSKMDILKPKQERYVSPYQAAMRDTLQKLTFGKLGETMGADRLKAMGIDLGDIRKTAGMDVPFSQSGTAKQFYPGTFVNPNAPAVPATPTMPQPSPFQNVMGRKFMGRGLPEEEEMPGRFLGR